MVCLKTYSRDQLVALRGDVTLSRCVRKVIFSHHLWLPAYARDLQNFHGSIHKYGRIVRRRNSNHCNQHWTPPQNESNPHGSTSVGLLNAQSLNNKFAAVCERILADRLSLCAVVETWHDGVDSPSLIGTAPPGYRYIEKARPRTTANQQTTLTNHGGVCLFYASFLGAREVTLPTYRSGLEALAVYIHGARRNAFFKARRVHSTRRKALYVSLLFIGLLFIIYLFCRMGNLLNRWTDRGDFWHDGQGWC